MRCKNDSGLAIGDSPRTSTVPCSGRSKPMMWRINVVLPEPLIPTKPKIDPVGIVKLTESNACLP